MTRILMAAALCAVLTACGGGGGGAADPLTGQGLSAPSGTTLESPPTGAP